jgi:hypothetical protein
MCVAISAPRSILQHREFFNREVLYRVCKAPRKYRRQISAHYHGEHAGTGWYDDLSLLKIPSRVNPRLIDEPRGYKRTRANPWQEGRRHFVFIGFLPAKASAIAVVRCAIRYSATDRVAFGFVRPRDARSDGAGHRPVEWRSPSLGWADELDEYPGSLF